MDFIFNAASFTFFVQNISTIIELLIGITLLVAVVVLYFQFFQDRGMVTETSNSGVGMSAELEQSLKRVLESQINVAPRTTAEPSEATSVESPAAAAKLQEAQTQLMIKEKEVESLRTQIAQSSTQTGNDKQLEDRIKELEARLAEYEIIAEDIADLSFYKEENQKLIKQMENLKTSNASAPSQPPAIAPAPVAQVIPLPQETPAAAPAPAPAPAPAIAAQPAVAAAAAQPAAPLATVTPINAAVSESKPAEPQTSDEELMKEFAAAVEAQKAETAAVPPKDEKAADAELMNQFEDFVKKKES